MYKLTGLLTGIVIAVMVAVNGGLTRWFGVFTAAVIIHAAGILFASLSIGVTRRKVRIPKGMPLWFYLGGVLGVFTTVFNNFAFGKISLTSIVAMGLLGQAVTSMLIDCLGLFGMKKYLFRKSSLLGLACSAAGILVMLDQSVGAAIYAVLLSFGAGVTVVVSRTVNAGLSMQVGELQGSLLNHVAGFPVTLVFLGIFGRNEICSVFPAFPSEAWVYLGGVLGVITVLLCNITVPHVPAFQLTLLTFVGQVFTGIVIDLIVKAGYSRQTFAGGLLVAGGIAVNLLCERVRGKNV